MAPPTISFILVKMVSGFLSDILQSGKLNTDGRMKKEERMTKQEGARIE